MAAPNHEIHPPPQLNKQTRPEFAERDVGEELSSQVNKDDADQIKDLSEEEIKRLIDEELDDL